MSTLLTLPETCGRLRCGRTAALGLIHSGQLVASKVAGKWLVSEQSVADLMDATSTRPRKRRARGLAS